MTATLEAPVEPLDLFALAGMAPAEIERELAQRALPASELDTLLRMLGLSLEPDPLAWQARGLCGQSDPEAFFPEKGQPSRDAKRICRACPVREECLQYAIDNDEQFGVWGGLSRRERRRLGKS